MSMVMNRMLESDGIIFGGAVRDMIICEEYAKRYHENLRSKKERFRAKNFWNTSIHPETAARTLVPRDIDVYFSNRESSDNFIRELQLLCEMSKIDFVIENTADDPSNTDRTYGAMLYVQKATLTHTVGFIPFLHRGFDITVEIDIVTSRYPISLQPPFKNVDFLCNGFIKTKHGIMYSQHTGTYIDKLSQIERTAEILKIQQDMLEFKTNFCRFEGTKHNLSTLGKNCYAYKRISKLLSKKQFPWTICNLPLKTQTVSSPDSDHTCCICLDDLAVGERFVHTETTNAEQQKVKASISHISCMLQYLDAQMDEALIVQRLDKKDKFTFVCPAARSPIDFTKCSCEYKKA